MEVDLVDNNNTELMRTEEQRVLLDEKNKLTEQVVEKYRLAGQIVQTALLHIENLLLDSVANSASLGEITREGTLFLQQLVDGVYRKTVEEKGIAIPVRLEKNEFVSGVSPEEGDDFQGGLLNHGDVVKITLGVYIDGYTAQASHTVVVKEYAQDGTAEEPLTGPRADAVCAAYLASEAAIGLLGITVSGAALQEQTGAVTGARLRWLVDAIAKAYRVQVLPGSRIRRVRRFLAGQDDIVDEADYKGVEWTSEKEISEEQALYEQEEVVAVSGEAWLVDIQMAATAGKRGVLSLKQFEGYDGIRIPQPTIFSRDYSIHYGLKLNASRALLARVNALSSVYPFKLSQVSEDAAELRSSKLGLKENLNHHILVAHPIQIAELTLGSSNTDRTTKEIRLATSSVDVAREMNTVVLVPAEVSDTGAGHVLRLTGGSKTGAPAYVHSQFELQETDINKLLELVNDKRHGIKIKTVQPGKYELTKEVELEAMEE